MTPKQERLRKAYEFKIGKERTSKLSDDQILLLSKYYNSLNDSEQSTVDNALAQGRRNDLTDMADAFISENEQDVYEPSDIIKQYDKQFDEAVAAYNKKVEDFKEKEDKRIAGMFQYDKPIGPQAMQGPKEPPVQGPRQASKDDEPWESEVQDQLGTKLDNILEQIRNEPLPQPSKTKRKKSRGKKKLSRKSYTAQELGVGESLNLILENVIETRESLFKLYKLEKERFEFKKKIDKKLTQQLAAKKRERKLEKEKKEQTFLQKKIKSAKKTIKQGLLDALISGAILFALPLIIDGIKGLLPGQRNNKPPSDPDAGSPTSAADQSGGLGQPDVPPGAVPIPVEEYKESEKTESESKPNTTAEPITPKEPLIPKETDPSSFTPYEDNGFGGFQTPTPSSSFSPFSFKTGGPVPGPRVNKDIVPAMLTPGEFVMSKGAVNKFGLNVMMSMNKAGGGTNRPTYKGMLPGYQGGGAVYGEPAIIKAGMDAGFSDAELAAFLAQVAHESGNFRYIREIWGPTPDQKGYEGRRDLGNTQPGDGKRYMGRGYIQITGRANYRRYGKKLGIDLENNPELAEQPDIAARIAVEYWKTDVRPMVGDDWSNVFKHSRAVNYPGATHPSEVNGMADRQKKFDHYRENIDRLKPKPEPVKPEEPPTPAFNAPGSEVRGYQGPPTPGTLRSFSGIGNFMEDLNFNLQVLGAERRTRSATTGQPPGAHPRRQMNALQQILQIFSPPTTPPEPPEFIPPTNTQPVGRRSPQQAGS